MFLQSCLPAQLRDSLLSLFFFLSFPGIHGKTGDWHSWFQWTRRMQSGGRSLLCASSGRTIWETPKSLTTTTSKIKVPPIIFIFRGLQKNISQVSQADRLAAIPPLQCRVCGGNTDFFYFFSLTCFVLFYFRLFKHWETSLHRNEPTRRVSPGTENYAASYWSDVSTILCSTYYTDTHTHWDTHMLRKNNPHTHTHTRSMRCTHKQKWKHGSFGAAGSEAVCCQQGGKALNGQNYGHGQQQRRTAPGRLTSPSCAIKSPCLLFLNIFLLLPLKASTLSAVTMWNPPPPPPLCSSGTSFAIQQMRESMEEKWKLKAGRVQSVIWKFTGAANKWMLEW